MTAYRRALTWFHISSILVIKFRGNPIGIIADIEKAFHQIQIAPDDRRMLKFRWLDDIERGRPEVK